MKKTVVLAVTVLTLSMAGTAVFAAGRGNEFGQNNSGTRMNCGRNCIYTNCGAGFVDENGDGTCDNYGNGNCSWRFADENGDGVCDYGCGNYGTGFVDENGDGVCDNYGTYGTYGTSKGTGTGSFIDGDGDGICDNLENRSAETQNGRGKHCGWRR